MLVIPKSMYDLMKELNFDIEKLNKYDRKHIDNAATYVRNVMSAKSILKQKSENENLLSTDGVNLIIHESLLEMDKNMIGDGGMSIEIYRKIEEIRALKKGELKRCYLIMMSQND